MKNIVVLGSTGKIGKAVLDIAREFNEEISVVGLSAYTNKELLDKQVAEFKPQIVCFGDDNLNKLTSYTKADLVVVSVVGLAGLMPTLNAISHNKNVALATKEVLVIAGDYVMKEAKKHNVSIIPIDSEHSALFQCLHTGKKKEIKKLILTMGKGPIARMDKKDMSKITRKDIQNRPHWSMGNKILVDSATCINKSFEVVEAKWLFDIKPQQIEVVVHPEYICHSLVEFQDGSIITELGTPDMRRYVQYALFYPERKPMKVTSGIDLVGKKLSFEKAPFDKFEGLSLGFDAIIKGGTMPAVLHGADVSAVKSFYSGQIIFTDIPKVIKRTMRDHKLLYNPTLEEILAAELWAQKYAQQVILNFYQ